VSERVTITPQVGVDANDDPLPGGVPFDVWALIAPGNTAVRYGADSQLDSVDFTAYLPLRVRQPSGWVAVSSLLTDNFTITIRDQVCVGRAREWNENGRGGIEILASIRSGATP
jgi:hypothetical protein